MCGSISPSAARKEKHMSKMKMRDKSDKRGRTQIVTNKRTKTEGVTVTMNESEGTKEKRTGRRILLISASLLMLVSAIPMFMWCLGLINNAALDYTYAGVGCFAAAILYVFSMVTAIAGLVFVRQPYRYRFCRVPAYIQLIVGLILVVPLAGYALLTLPPLFLLTILYLIGAKK